MGARLTIERSPPPHGGRRFKNALMRFSADRERQPASRTWAGTEGSEGVQPSAHLPDPPRQGHHTPKKSRSQAQIRQSASQNGLGQNAQDQNLPCFVFFSILTQESVVSLVWKLLTHGSPQRGREAGAPCCTAWTAATTLPRHQSHTKIDSRGPQTRQQPASPPST
jgi:hypothetical protein